MSPPYFRPLPAQVDLPALEHEVLRPLAGRARSSSARSSRPRAARPGSSTRARPPPTACPACTTSRPASSRTCSRATRPCRASRAPQGRLGLPRPAGRGRRREGARPHRQAGHRGVRRRRVQRQLPRVGAAARRRLRGDDRADGLLGRPVAGVPDHGPGLHRVGLVVAQGHLRQGPAVPRLPDHARTARAAAPACPTTSWASPAATRPSSSPSVYVRMPVDLRPAGRARRRPAGLDDHAVDAGLQHRGRRAPRRDLRRGAHRRAARCWWSPSRCSPVLGEGGTRCWPPHRAASWSAPPTGGRSTWSTSPTRTTWCSATTSPPRTAPAWSTRRPRSAPTTWPPAGATACPWSTRSAPTGASSTTCRWSAGCSSRTPTRRSPRTCATAACCSAAATSSTATRTAGAATPPLLYYALPVLVHPDHRDQGPAAGGERDDQLVPRHDQVGPLRRVAAQQRRLVAVAHPLLGHAAAAVGVLGRRVPRHLRRLAGGAGRAGRRRTCPRSTRTARTSTTSPSPARPAAARPAGCPT